jgi:hypothetical protein
VSDPIKIVIFIAVFAALLLIGRKLSSYDSSHAVPGPSIPPAAYGLKVDQEVEEEVKSLPAVVGADLPFPIFLPDIEMDKDGRYNRPELLNYFFEKTDLVLGPADPRNFIDQFFMEVRDLENNHTGAYRYAVATPAGLQQELDSMRVPALVLGEQMIIVSRWDMPLILKTVVDEILKAYQESHKDLPGTAFGKHGRRLLEFIL